jgi:proteasome accessory factor C
VWISPERARWAREERTVTGDLEDGAVVVERGFASTRYLVRDVLKEAGDAMVLEPDDARVAVRDAAGAIRAGIAPVTAR